MVEIGVIGSYEMQSLVLPKKFHSFFGKSFILAISAYEEPCLIILDPEKMGKINGADIKFWCGIKINEEGKIIIPRPVRKKIFEFLKIKKEDRLVFVGLLNIIEIWKKDDWENYKKKYNYEEILQKFLSYQGSK